MIYYRRMSDSAAASAYNEIAYGGYPIQQSHPDRLATQGTLWGMDPAPLSHCSVLELGCGDGANLIPMALEFPGSTFVGIDLADAPIRQGQEAAAALGLVNLTLQAMDVMAAGPALG